MKFYNYLKEYKTLNRSIVLGEENFISLLKSGKYSSAMQKYKDGKGIYRGIYAFNGSIGIINPSSFTRHSRNTHNFYTLLIDNSPLWKDYPKRSQSIICTNSTQIAYAYNGFSYYAVLPKNDSKIGICPTSDIWGSFKIIENSLNISSLAEFNNVIFGLIKLGEKSWNDKFKNDVIDKISLKNPIESYELFVKILNHLTNYFKTFDVSILKTDDYYNIFKILIDHVKSGKNLLQIFNELFDPKLNNFDLVSIENYNINDTGFSFDTREVWTDGESLLIRNDVIKKYLK